MYDIGEGLVLMNVITKNENGKMHQITTYIGIEGNGFVCVGNSLTFGGLTDQFFAALGKSDH